VVVTAPVKIPGPVMKLFSRAPGCPFPVPFFKIAAVKDNDEIDGEPG